MLLVLWLTTSFTAWQRQLQMLSHNVSHFQSTTTITAANATASCYWCQFNNYNYFCSLLQILYGAGVTLPDLLV